MQTDCAQLELQLIQSLDQREEKFQAALRLTESLPACLEAGDYGQSQLEKLTQLLHDVRDLERDAASLLDQWKFLGGIPGAELASRIDRVSQQIEELLNRLTQAEQFADAARQRLKPQMTQRASGRRMRDAYKEA
ncbi:MAG: hypothetical protein VB858_10520 [Planctomycetaceae bacterium]